MLCSQNCFCGQGCDGGALEVKKWNCALRALSRTLVSTFQGHLKIVKK